MNTKNIFPHVIIVILFTFIFNNTFASDADSTGGNKSIVISYWGTLRDNPGLKLGIEKAYLQSLKYTVIGSVSLLLNRKPDIYTSAGLTFGSTLRRTGKFGLYLEHELNFGYLGKYYEFNTYRTNSAEDIVNVGSKWTSSLMLGYSFGIGYDFSKKTKTNLQIYFKPGIYYLLPNKTNFFYVNNYSFEVGLALHPKWLNISK
jgi:hypothetical protein